MNSVIISGKVLELISINDQVGMFVIRVDKSTNHFYVFYERLTFTDLDVKIGNKSVNLLGSLEHIRVKLPEKDITKRVVAIKLEEIEIVNDF